VEEKCEFNETKDLKTRKRAKSMQKKSDKRKGAKI
jgi:hypothetical protein